MTSVNAPSKNILQTTKRVELRFNEVDSMGLVWHGHYAKFFEDAREEFGKKFGLGYLDIYDSGFYAPLVDLQFQYKKPLNYRNKYIDVVITFRNTEAAKIIFDYQIFTMEGQLATVGSSTQVFVNMDYELMLQNPPFFMQWKAKNLLK